jgi:hypothetical protein
MEISMKYKLSIASILGTLFLTACSGEPSDTDIKKAVGDNINQKNENNIHLFGSQNANLATIKLIDIKKLSDCSKEPNGKEYSCNLQVTIDSQIMGKKTTNAKFNFIKDNDDNWVLLEPSSSSVSNNDNTTSNTNTTTNNNDNSSKPVPN